MRLTSLWAALIPAFVKADYDATVLTSVKENAVCSMASAIPPLDQAAQMYKTGDMHHDANPENNTDVALRQMFGAAITVMPDIQAFFAGYQNGGFLIWFQDGAFPVPTSWTDKTGATHTNLSPYVWGYTGGPKDYCPEWGVQLHKDQRPGKAHNHTGCRQEYYTDKNTLVPLASGFKAREFDVLNRGWYAVSVTSGSMWSDLYLDFSTGLVITSVCVVAHDKKGAITGVMAADVLLTAFEVALQEAVAGKSPDMRVFVMESETTSSSGTKQHRMIAASTPGVAMDPTDGSQVEATLCTDAIIADVAKTLIGKGVAANGDYFTETFIADGAFIQAAKVDGIGGVAFEGGKSWFFVVVQPIECRPGWQVNDATFKCERCIAPFNSVGGDKKCTICEPGYFMNSDDQCTSCPEGTTCDGLTTIKDIDLKKGYWRISGESTEALECPLDQGCVGGQDSTDYCREGYEGVLCAKCNEEFYFSKDTNDCIDCGAPGVTTAVERVRASIVLSLVFFVFVIFCGGFIIIKLTPGLQGQAREFIDKAIENLNWLRLKTKMKIKCLLSFAQISATMSFNCGMRFPDSFEQIMNIFSICNLEVIPALGVPCWMKKFDYIRTMMTMTLTPICLGVFIMLIYFVNNYGEYFPSKEEGGRMTRSLSRAELTALYEVPEDMESAFTRQELRDLRKTFGAIDKDGGGELDKEELFKIVLEVKPEVTKEDIDDIFDEAKTMVPGGDPEIFTWIDFLEVSRMSRKDGTESALSLLADQIEAKVSANPINNYVYAILLLTFLVLPGCTTVLFNFFKCHEFHMPGEGTVSYMYKDYGISCDSDRYKGFIAYAVFMLIVYPVGIPLGWSVMLYKAREVIGDEKAMAREYMFGSPKTGHLSFLIESYKCEFYYFEVLECMRRILLTSAVGLGNEDTADSAIAGVLISLVFIFIFSEAKPFKFADNSALGVLLMYTLTAMFLCALLVKLGAVSSENGTFAALLMILLIGSLALGLVISVLGPTYFKRFGGNMGAGQGAQAAKPELAPNGDLESKKELRLSSLDQPAKEADVVHLVNKNIEEEKQYQQTLSRLNTVGELKGKGLLLDENFDTQVSILNKQLKMVEVARLKRLGENIFISDEAGSSV